MRTNKSSLNFAIASIALFVLIIDAKTAINAASEGISLCVSTVIPSLFPFCVISIYLSEILSVYPTRYLRPLERMLRLPPNTAPVMLLGFFGGYPVGAKCIQQMFTSQSISRADAHRMLSFCCNAGPAYIFGIGALLFPDSRFCWLVWLIQIVSAFVVACLSPAASCPTTESIVQESFSGGSILRQAINVIATVSGWIILFRIILAFVKKWVLWLLPEGLAILLSGMLELANGCSVLLQAECLVTKFILFTVMLSFGGICVHLQTATVLSGSGLSIRPYLLGKSMQCTVAAFLCAWIIPFWQDAASTKLYLCLSIPVLMMLPIYLFFTSSKKCIAFSNFSIYNRDKHSGGRTYETFPQEN